MKKKKMPVILQIGNDVRGLIPMGHLYGQKKKDILQVYLNFNYITPGHCPVVQRK